MSSIVADFAARLPLASLTGVGNACHIGYSLSAGYGRLRIGQWWRQHKRRFRMFLHPRLRGARPSDNRTSIPISDTRCDPFALWVVPRYRLDLRRRPLPTQRFLLLLQFGFGSQAWGLIEAIVFLGSFIGSLAPGESDEPCDAVPEVSTA